MENCKILRGQHEVPIQSASPEFFPMGPASLHKCTLCKLCSVCHQGRGCCDDNCSVKVCSSGSLDMFSGRVRWVSNLRRLEGQ